MAAPQSIVVIGENNVQTRYIFKADGNTLNRATLQVRFVAVEHVVLFLFHFSQNLEREPLV